MKESMPSDMIGIREAVDRIMQAKGCGRRKAEKILQKLLSSGEVRSYFVPERLIGPDEEEP